MSEENLALVKEAFRRFTAGDMPGLAALYTPDAVVVAPEGWPEAGPFEGREAVMQEFERLREDWEDTSIKYQKEASGRDRVAAEWVWTVRGGGSGVPANQTFCGAWRIRDGKIAEVRFCWKWEEALEAAGLSE